MLGGLVSWVITGLLRATSSLAPRGTVHSARPTTDRCSTAPAEAAAPTLHVWRPDGSMSTGIVNGRTGAAGACRDGDVTGYAEASRTLPAVAHAVAVQGQGLLEPGRYVLKWQLPMPRPDLQHVPRGHRRARCTWIPCFGRRVTSPHGSTGGPGTSCMRHV